MDLSKVRGSKGRKRGIDGLGILAPDYLPAVPNDPLAAEPTQIGYISVYDDPERPRVYSVGMDGVDDGGANC